MVLWGKIEMVKGSGFGSWQLGWAIGCGWGNWMWVGFTMDMRVQAISRNIELQ